MSCMFHTIFPFFDCFRREDKSGLPFSTLVRSGSPSPIFCYRVDFAKEMLMELMTMECSRCQECTVNRTKRPLRS